MNVKDIPDTISTTAGKAGTTNDMFTGYWEVTEIPSSENIPKDRVNVGVWKTSAGVIKSSASTVAAKEPTGTTTQATNAITIGNGTENPVIAYQIRPNSSEGYIETAQMR